MFVQLQHVATPFVFELRALSRFPFYHIIQCGYLHITEIKSDIGLIIRAITSLTRLLVSGCYSLILRSNNHYNYSTAYIFNSVFQITINIVESEGVEPSSCLTS